MLHRNFFDDAFFAPFRMDRLVHDMDRFFRGVQRGSRLLARSFPPVNIHTGEAGALVTAEVPGLAAEDLELSVLGNTLTLEGTRPATEHEDGARIHRQERQVGRFTRVVQLPFRVDPEAVEATVKDGRLEVRLTRPAEDRPKRIPVRAEG